MTEAGTDGLTVWGEAGRRGECVRTSSIAAAALMGLGLCRRLTWVLYRPGQTVRSVYYFSVQKMKLVDENLTSLEAHDSSVNINNIYNMIYKYKNLLFKFHRRAPIV